MERTWRASDVVILLVVVAVGVMTYLQMVQADRNHDRLVEALGKIKVVGRAGANDPERRRQGDWLVRHLGAEPRTLNPITANDWSSTLVHQNVFDSLIEIDYDTFDWVPQMAESWTISDDKLTITFKLRPGMVWSDGTPITADDAVFSFETMMDPKVEAMQARVYYEDVESVRALDEVTLEFKFKRPYFKSFEVAGELTIIPRHVYRYDDPMAFNRVRTKLVGSGPYVFEEWEPQQKIVLKRNPRYYGAPPNFDKIVFKVVSDDNAAYQSVKAQQLDLMGLTAAQFVQSQEDEKFNVHYRRLVYSSPRGSYGYIGWNLRNPLFKDRRVRRALTHLIPRQRIVDELFHGLYEVPTGPFWPGAEGIDLPLQADSTIKPWPFDAGQAVALLTEAGWRDTDGDGILDKDGRAFAFTLLIPQSAQTSLDMAAVAKEEMGKVGLRMKIEQLEWSVFQDKMDARAYDAVLLAWVQNSVESDPYQIWHSKSIERKGSNHIGFNNPEADRMIESARVEFDREKRNRIYQQFHRLLHEEQPYTFLLRGKSRVAIHKRFEGVVVHPFGLRILEWWTPQEKRLYVE